MPISDSHSFCLPLSDSLTPTLLSATLVTLTLSAEDTELDNWLKDEEANREFFIVSELNLISGANETSARVEKSPHAKCGRCWRQVPSVGKIADAPDLCDRCYDAISSSDS